MNLRAEVDLEVLGVVKDVQEGAALLELGDAEEAQCKVRETSQLSLVLLNGISSHWSRPSSPSSPCGDANQSIISPNQISDAKFPNKL